MKTRSVVALVSLSLIIGLTIGFLAALLSSANRYALDVNELVSSSLIRTTSQLQEIRAGRIGDVEAELNSYAWSQVHSMGNIKEQEGRPSREAQAAIEYHCQYFNQVRSRLDLVEARNRAARCEQFKR
jgi:hypothetical protein